MWSLVDFGFLISCTVAVYRLVFDYGLPVDTAAILLVGAAFFAVATNLTGSKVRRANQPLKGFLSLAGFAWGASGHDFSGAMTIGIYGLAIPIALYGLYIVIKSPFVNK